MKKIIFSLLILPLLCASQNPAISPQVLNSAGDHRQVGTSGIWITDNIGEPFTESIGINGGKLMITEGFIQPETITKAGFTLNPIQQSLQCLDKEDDAFIALALTSTTSKYKAKYIWSPSSVCPNNDCPKIDTIKPGPYSVTVAIQYTTNTGAIRQDTITRNFYIDAATIPCKIKIFNGVSANNDNVNDYFAIENIKEYPNNHVTIFNRWGNQVFDMKGYDQDVHLKRWPSDDHLSTLVSSTYFYVVELGDGSKPLKGWVELIKN